MGFDIEGISPTKSVGDYFRNNIWYWKTLSFIIESLCSEFLTSEQLKGLHFNDGVEYDDITAKKIADVLEENFDKLHIYAKPIQQTLQFSPGNVMDFPYTNENTLSFIDFARHSGGFNIW